MRSIEMYCDVLDTFTTALLYVPYYLFCESVLVWLAPKRPKDWWWGASLLTFVNQLFCDGCRTICHLLSFPVNKKQAKVAANCKERTDAIFETHTRAEHFRYEETRRNTVYRRPGRQQEPLTVLSSKTIVATMPLSIWKWKSNALLLKSSVGLWVFRLSDITLISWRIIT